jgi:thioredoxin 1
MSELIRHTTMETFESDVLDAGRPVLVDFHADWCGPCQAIAPVLSDLAQQRQGDVEIRKVNVDHHPDLATRYAVRGIPTLILFKGGRAVGSVVGAASRGAIDALIEQHAHGT